MADQQSNRFERRKRGLCLYKQINEPKSTQNLSVVKKQTNKVNLPVPNVVIESLNQSTQKEIILNREITTKKENIKKQINKVKTLDVPSQSISKQQNSTTAELSITNEQKKKSENLQTQSEGSQQQRQLEQLLQRKRIYQLQLRLLNQMSQRLSYQRQQSIRIQQQKNLEQDEQASSPSCTLCRKRLENEKKEIKKNPPMNWKALDGPKWNIWKVWITANVNTPFNFQPFQLIVTFPQKYPYEKPTFKLAQHRRFFHPNISSASGGICQATIKSSEAYLTARQRINAIVQLLSIPNPNSPLNSEAAKLYLQDHKKYYKKALRIYMGFQKAQ